MMLNSEPGASAYPAGISTQWSPRNPGAVRVVRIIGWIQAGLLGIVCVIGALAAVEVSSAANSVDLNGVGDIASGAIAVIIFLLVLITASLMVPLTLLKRGRPNPPIALTVSESALGLFALYALTKSGSSPLPALILLIASGLVVVLLWRPKVRAWARPISGPAPSMNPTAAISAPAGQWAADPGSKHEMRWYDGERWTDHVSNRGAVTWDPLA